MSAAGAAPSFVLSGKRARNLRLLDGETLRGLSRRSDGAGLLRLAVHLGAIGLGASLVQAALGSPWLAPAMLLQGLFLVSLFAPIHECIHETAFRSRRLSRAVGWLVALPTLLNADFYRHFHMAHHKHCQDPARDPELRPPPPDSRAGYLLRVSGLPYWRARIQQLCAMALGRFEAFDFIPEGERAAVRRSVLGMIAVYAAILAASVATGSLAALWFWILPALLARPFLQLYLLSEHTGCSADDDVLRNTRTTLALWPIRLMMWNMPFHTAHHLYPQIPFHALPKAQALLADSGMVTAFGYLATNWTLFRTAR
jgi:fatty acid desaturase